MGFPPRVVVTVCDGRWLSSWCCSGSGSGSLLVLRVVAWCCRVWCVCCGCRCRVVVVGARVGVVVGALVVRVCLGGGGLRGCWFALSVVVMVKDVARLVTGEEIAADGPPVG